MSRQPPPFTVSSSNMYLRVAAAVPGSKKDSAFRTSVSHVLQARHEVRYTANTEAEAEDSSPRMRRAAGLVGHRRHRPLATGRTVDRGGPLVQRGQRRGHLVLWTALLDKHNAWRLNRHRSHLDGRRVGILLLQRWLTAVRGLLGIRRLHLGLLLLIDRGVGRRRRHGLGWDGRRVRRGWLQRR